MSNHNFTTPRGRNERLRCAISGAELARTALTNLEMVRPSLVERMKQDHPDLAADAFVSNEVIGKYRSLYVQDMLKAESGELNDIDRQVAESLATQETLAENVEDDFEEDRSLGQRLSDHLATFGGSWTFLIFFAIFLAAWMALNVWEGEKGAFDAYPFILLNLILSTIAAIQAPIIMMSQKRQEAKDRLRALNDYRVNLKAELEIRHLHEKIDHMINNQWQRLAEIQQMQLEMLGERRK